MAVLGQSLAFERAALPQCPMGTTPNSIWETPVALATGTPSAPSIDTFRTDRPGGGSVSYVSSGNTLYAICNKSPGGGGTPCTPGNFVWTWDTGFGGPNVQNFVSPVPLKGCNSGGTCVFGIFFAEQSGYLRGINADTAANLTSWGAGFDTRRGACADDEILATPAVQLKDFSNGSFTQTEDLVIVITRTMCGNTSQNRVMAIGAQSATLKWTFNPNAIGLLMDYGSEGGALDYVNNRIYFGTNHPGVAGAYRTIWAINTNDGSLAWSKNVGAVRARPNPRGTHLYTVIYPGTLKAFRLSTGADLYSLAITGGGATVVRNTWPESRGPYKHTLFAVDFNSVGPTGFLHSIVEADLGPGVDQPCNYMGANTGVCGSTTWAPVNLGGVVNSFPAILPILGKAYVGLTNGEFHQVNLATGASEAQGVLDGTVYDPSLDFEDGVEINRIVAASRVGLGNPTVKRFCAPWTPGHIGVSSVGFDDVGPLNHPDCRFPPEGEASCTAADPSHCMCWNDRFAVGTTSCHKGVCHESDKLCFSEPENDLTLCDRNIQNLRNTRCRDGNCALGQVIADDCTFAGINKPDRHCQTVAGQQRMCCQNGSVAEAICVDILTSNQHCGACKNNCGGQAMCCGGTCVNTATSNEHCGRCGQPCPATARCCNGTCVPAAGCDYCCQGVCRPMNEQNCGGCFDQCGPTQRCCTGHCTDMQFDVTNCGDCDVVCTNKSNLCYFGQCWCGSPGNPPCGATETCCGSDGCRKLNDDPNNCGNCGYKCPPSAPNCVNGACQ